MPIAIALDAAIALFKRYRILIAIVPLTLALGIQTWRLNSAKDALEDCRNDQARLLAASDANLKAQIAQREKDKAAYTAAKLETELTHAKQLASAHDSLDRYIAANRLRQDHRGGGPNTGSQGAATGSDQAMSASAVLVSEAELRICTDNTAALIAAHEWGQRLIREGLAQ
jgi:hypothetical protein